MTLKTVPTEHEEKKISGLHVSCSEADRFLESLTDLVSYIKNFFPVQASERNGSLSCGDLGPCPKGGKS